MVDILFYCSLDCYRKPWVCTIIVYIIWIPNLYLMKWFDCGFFFFVFSQSMMNLSAVDSTWWCCFISVSRGSQMCWELLMELGYEHTHTHTPANACSYKHNWTDSCLNLIKSWKKRTISPPFSPSYSTCWESFMNTWTILKVRVSYLTRSRPRV